MVITRGDRLRVRPSRAAGDCQSSRGVHWEMAASIQSSEHVRSWSEAFSREWEGRRVRLKAALTRRDQSLPSQLPPKPDLSPPLESISGRGLAPASRSPVFHAHAHWHRGGPPTGHAVTPFGRGSCIASPCTKSPHSGEQQALRRAVSNDSSHPCVLLASGLDPSAIPATDVDPGASAGVLSSKAAFGCDAAAWRAPGQRSAPRAA
jgi:hypothetical protein